MDGAGIASPVQKLQTDFARGGAGILYFTT
jgi:hypothetical protein